MIEKITKKNKMVEAEYFINEEKKVIYAKVIGSHPVLKTFMECFSLDRKFKLKCAEGDIFSKDLGVEILESKITIYYLKEYKAQLSKLKFFQEKVFNKITEDFDFVTSKLAGYNEHKENLFKKIESNK